MTTHETRAGASIDTHMARMAVTLAVFHLEMSSLMLFSPRNLQEALHLHIDNSSIITDNSLFDYYSLVQTPV